jgi:hypothetical protein
VISPVTRLLWLLLPLLLLGAAAGALRVRAAFPAHPPRRRRLFQIAWVVLLLVGAPAWLVAAALLGLW